MKNNPLAYLLLSALLLIGAISASAQNLPSPAPKDYSKYPYWIEMMQDPHGNFFEIQKAFYTYWQGQTGTRGSGYKPFKRWEYYWQTRINPDGSFPEPDKVYREYNKYVQSHPVGAGFKTGQPVWQELGPKTRLDYGGYVGVGRINAIAFHPTDTATVYIGAPKGGLWVTHDGGHTWASHTETLPTLGVSAILVNPVNPNLMLIGTGDRDGGNSNGMGVFRSDDGGLTWIPFNTGMGNVTVGMFAQPQTNLRMILAAANGGIYKSVDSGENWVKTSPNSSNYRDIKFRPGSETIAYAACDNGFYRSENGGDTWTLLPTSAGYPGGGRLVIGVTPANDSLVYLVGGADAYQGCFLSRDFGKTFKTQSTAPNILGGEYDGSGNKSQAWYDLMIHVDLTNPQLVFVGGINIWKSLDGGKTWQITCHWWGDRTNEVHADQHTFAFNPANNRLYAGNDGGIYYTANQGTTYKEISEGLGIGQLYKIGVSNTDAKKMTAGFQDNGSATWIGTNWVNSGGGDGMECAVDPYDSRYSYTTIYYGPITRYFNNASGRGVAGKGTNGIDEEGAWVTPFIIGKNDGNTMVAGYKNVWISRNVKSSGTITWTKISNNLAGKNDQNMAILEQSPADFNVLYAVRSDSKLFRTDSLLTSAVTWTDLTSKLPVSGTPSDIKCHPYNPNVVYMILNQKVYKSITKGGNWENITGNLPAISINTIVFDKASNEGLYVGTDAGVYYKDVDMTDWALYGEALPVSVGVNELEIYQDPRNRSNSRLRAATFGRGAWEIGLADINPSVPPAMLASEIVDSKINLTWIPPFYEQNVLSYRIYRNGALLATVTGTDYTDTKAESDVTYKYTVTAVYSGGSESANTNEVMATIVSPIELPYDQTFETSTGGYTAKYTMEGWKYGTAETLLVTGREGYFFAANSSAAGAGVSISDYLTTPSIDLNSYKNRTITLRFSYTFRKYRTYDKFSVNYRVAPDSAWVKLMDMTPPGKSSWVWDTTELNLPEKALTARMQIGFFYDNSNQFAWGAAVDDVNLYLNTTSVQTIGNPASISVFPNPSQGLFNLGLTSGVTGRIKIQVLNMTGQVVFEKFVENNSGILNEKIDLSSQPKGIYQLTVRSESAEWKQRITLQ